VRGRGAIAGLLAAAAGSAFAPPAAASQATLPLHNAGPGLLSATATPFPLSEPGPLDALRFKNRDGYTITISAFEQTVALSVARLHHAGSRAAPTTTYLAHGRITPTSIRVSFADRGQIALRFRATRPPLRAKSGSACRARHGVIARQGVFVGDLRFQGEGGYTSAHVHRAKGATIDIAALFSCALSPAASSRRAERSTRALLASGFPSFDARSPTAFLPGRPPPETPTHPSVGPRSTALFADRKLPLARTIFFAEESGGGPPLFLAVDERSEGSIAIVRHVLVTGTKAAFAVDDSLALASVTPPAPFSGTGSFLVGPEGVKSWTGSLAVSFPGALDVPLVGPPFRAQLVRGL
jgi:hypothetical protein